ncbi:uncharacterized protein [Typha latifolia]|uniref:uncharacterized protein n=1 Tax=Typha latifolia TaxID=4733 RepID=UPI003C30507F
MAKVMGSETRVLFIAFLSRFLLLTLILLWRLLFSPYDTSASLNPGCLSAAFSSGGGKSPASDPVLWPRLAAAIESSIVWDGVYFVRIAECGYEYEQTYAFLPLLPAAMVLLSRSVFAPLVPVIGYRATLALSGYALNNVAFVFATLYLYRLSVLVLKDSAAALCASVLFSFNPASVFYSSVYSESLYALFSLGGVFYLFSGAKTVATMLLALSGSARSNGALNAGYLCFLAILQAYVAIIQKKKPMLAVKAILAAIMCSIFIFVPFLAFQAYGYLNICLDGASYGRREWCKEKVPLLYGFLQSHYWGVGFLRYFQVKQLPNFLLASPVLSLAVCSIVHYGNVLHQLFQSSFMHEQIISAAQLQLMRPNESSDVIWTSKNIVSSKSPQGVHAVRQRKQDRKDGSSASLQDIRSIGQTLHQAKQGEISITFLPFVLHLAFMTFMAFFMMHVQVATRFLSASPPIYWFASYVFVTATNASTRWRYLFWVYSVTYILLGSLLFSNFYPFT